MSREKHTTSIRLDPRPSVDLSSDLSIQPHAVTNSTPATSSSSSTQLSTSKASSVYDSNGSTACATPRSPSREGSFLGLSSKLEKLPGAKALECASDFTTFDHEYPSSLYEVDEICTHDDYDRMPLWKRRFNALVPITTALSLFSYLAYLVTRIIFTVDASRHSPSSTFVMAWLFVSTECLVAMPNIFHNIFQLAVWRGRRRAKLRLAGNTYVPTVDVLITCCKEEPEVILDTARAACSVDYPSDRFRVVVTDDGADNAVKHGVEALRLTFPNIYYFSRVKVKGKPHHFKAGNLIGATDFVDKLEGGRGEYIASLDADMIPEPHWLRTVIAPFVKDPKLGLACPPQLFYNVPVDDPLTQTLDGFAHIMEPVKDAKGIAWCTGSGYAIRRKALDSIGGWPTGSLAEDTYTSSSLLGAGWNTAFIHEALQYGTIPEDYASHLKQRTRWTLGTLQTSVKLRFCLYGDAIRHMTFWQRLSGFVFTFDVFWKIFYVVALNTMPIVLFSGHRMVAFANNHQLVWSLGLNLLSTLLSMVNEWITALPSGYRQTIHEMLATIWMSPYHAITVIQSFLLPTWLGGKAMAFSPSGSLKSTLHERDPRFRAPLARRLKVIIWDCKAYIHLIYILFSVAALTLSTTRAFTTTGGSRGAVLFYLLTHAFWPPFMIVKIIAACLTPLSYAIWPPSMPTDREELLDRDPVTQVAHPRAEFRKQRWSLWNWHYEVQGWLMGAYTVVAFALVYHYMM